MNGSDMQTSVVRASDVQTDVVQARDVQAGDVQAGIARAGLVQTGVVRASDVWASDVQAGEQANLSSETPTGLASRADSPVQHSMSVCLGTAPHAPANTPPALPLGYNASATRRSIGSAAASARFA